MPHSKVLVAQLGARKHYQEPILFHERRILDSFYTDFYSGHNKLVSLLRYPKIYSKLPNFFKKSLDRYDPALKNTKIVHFPVFGYQYAHALKKATPDQISKVFAWAGKEFCRQIINYGLGEANTIYGFNSACLELFEYAKKHGISCILDQTLADYSCVHKLLLEEEERWQEWSLMPFSVSSSDIELLNREHREQDLADRIICGSSFVKESLISRGVDLDKIAVVPLGRLKAEDNSSLNQTPPQSLINRESCLKILFVGSVGLRKGIPYLLSALRQIKTEIPFICKIAGSIEIKPERIAEYADVCEFMGRIPRSLVKPLYAWADVVVLPSICEGSAMVTYEALSLGVPIITTHNSGSIVRDGIDGYIVPIRDIDAITDKLFKIYTRGDRDRKLLNINEYLQFIYHDSETKLIRTIEEVN